MMFPNGRYRLYWGPPPACFRCEQDPNPHRIHMIFGIEETPFRTVEGVPLEQGRRPRPLDTSHPQDDNRSSTRKNPTRRGNRPESHPLNTKRHTKREKKKKTHLPNTPNPKLNLNLLDTLPKQSPYRIKHLNIPHMHLDAQHFYMWSRWWW